MASAPPAAGQAGSDSLTPGAPGGCLPFGFWVSSLAEVYLLVYSLVYSCAFAPKPPVVRGKLT